ncbi:hypothetical protein B0O80DRAFT_460466 [Mortierella sp. GBAus27b]|nr:hypothetical protein BGX31_008739 [Mortierella sp. GBA43]KAI8349345.1 hypothetical protein B0O80DRAFT_460466 [Mortierella sp. GBAus27b]
MNRLPQQVIDEAIRRLERGESIRSIGEVLTISPGAVANIKKKNNIEPETHIRKSNHVWMRPQDAPRVYAQQREEDRQLKQERRKWKALIAKHAKDMMEARAAEKVAAKIAKEAKAAEKTPTKAKAGTKAKSTATERKDDLEREESDAATESVSEPEDKTTAPEEKVEEKPKPASKAKATTGAPKRKRAQKENLEPEVATTAPENKGGSNAKATESKTVTKRRKAK